MYILFSELQTMILYIYERAKREKFCFLNVYGRVTGQFARGQFAQKFAFFLNTNLT